MEQTPKSIENPPSVSGTLGDDVSGETEVITMLDVLKEEEELEVCTKALLGASDEDNCTYSKGYMKRQALYACISCTPNWDENALSGGICVACSYHCHEGHELIELYTKRNFRCDCGNSKFPGTKCNLIEKKSPVNEQNHYNQNFRGLYCVCKRPYPDPEDNTNDAMMQCTICEDWYHERHLECKKPISLDDGELICGTCLEQNPFLFSYVSSDVIVTDEPCALTAMQSTSSMNLGQAIVLPEGWRSRLCKCDKCMTMYEERGLKYLLDEQDTVMAYEAQGKAKSSESQYERGMRVLSSMDRVQTVQAIKGFNDMKSQLMEYLQKFADGKKVVREEDIKEFFSEMNARKKQRVDEVNIPHFCR